MPLAGSGLERVQEREGSGEKAVAFLSREVERRPAILVDVAWRCAAKPMVQS